MKTVLGIDLGTQSLKTLFYDYQSQQMAAIASSELQVDRDRHGRAEQQADWWLAALRDCLGRTPDSLRETVQAIGVSGQQHGFVAMDEQGGVLAPVKLWCDTSTQEEADQITAACGGRDQSIELAGNPILTGYTATKVLWLKNHRPGLYQRLARILLPHDYLNYVLTGLTRMEYGDASGTGFFDVHTRTWSDEVLSAIDPSGKLQGCLPELAAADQFIGVTSGEFSQCCGLPEGIPVSTGGGDNMMGAIGTGNVTTCKLTMSLGSSATLYSHSTHPVIDPRGEIAAFCSSTDGWLPLLCTMNCTLSTELMRHLLDVSIDDFDDCILNIPAGSDGLTLLPFFNGERTPNLPEAKACLLGMDTHNCGKGHLLRATVEGVTYGLKYGLDRLVELGLGAEQIVLTGGGANSGVWRQIIADVCQLPVAMLNQDEGACFGAALQALWVLQRQTDTQLSIGDITAQHLSDNEDSRAEPDPNNIAIYEDSYRQYQRSLKQISPLYT